jgi:hypothetical protein
MEFNAKALGSSLFTGLAIQYMPNVLKGFMAEYLCHVSVKEFVAFVKKDENLWEKLPIGYKDALMEYGPKLGDLEWFNADWIMESGRAHSPGLYSLVLGWPEGRQWLQRQVEDIKKAIRKQQGETNGRGTPQDVAADCTQPVSGVREQPPAGGVVHSGT